MDNDERFAPVIELNEEELGEEDKELMKVYRNLYDNFDE